LKQAEQHLARAVFQINQTAAHDRPLRGVYSYEQILGQDLADQCLQTLERKGPPVRVLDIGCGSGLALHQLEQAITQRGLRQHFEFLGMGLNWYQRMHISPTRFLMTGLYHSRYRGPRFDLVFSVFAFHYIWHKLEGLEKIHNELLADHGLALIHFPAFLVRLPDSAGAVALDEVAGNQAFERFLEDFHVRQDSPGLEYSQVPLFSEDDDRAMLNEFGHLRLTRVREVKLDFGLSLARFGVVPADFRYKYSGVSKPDYVLSYYERRPPQPTPGAAASELEAPGLARTRVRVPGPPGAAELELAVHPLLSPLLVVLFPGSREGLENSALPFDQIAANVQEAGLGAVVRCNNPLEIDGEITVLLREHMHRLMEYIRANAKAICGTARPRLAMMGYSSGAGAIAAFAAEYTEVNQILLVAPSLDVGREAIEDGLSAFHGEVHIVIGDSDEIVLPEQARWFFEAAHGAVRKRLVEIACCNHAFSGEYNQALIRHAPLWAFGGSKEFPPADLSHGW